MLVELTIRNFAIISQVSVSFEKGLTVLTGETGAGKSILLDALSLLMGGRASVEYIRHGEEKAEIEALFYVEQGHQVQKALEAQDITIDEGTLILKRDITAQGKSICRINGHLITLSVMREVGQALVDIHGQHEHQNLLHDDKHLILLDSYGKKEIEAPKQAYQRLYAAYEAVLKEMKELSKNERDMAQRLDLFKYQLNEITAADLQPGEDEALYQEKKRRSYVQKLGAGLGQGYQALFAESGALDSIAQAMDALQAIVQYDPDLEPLFQQVESIYYQLEDTSHIFSKQQEQLEDDPERLNVIEHRLMEIESLKRKYGNSIEEILTYATRITEDINSFENKEEHLIKLAQRKEHLEAELTEAAKKLSQKRKETASVLSKEIKQELQGLYMDKTELVIHLESGLDQEQLQDKARVFFAEGWDSVQFLIAPNPGEPLKPLSKIASGGELSRLMLALKTVFSKNETITTLIFDEVDTGVSGRVAQAMAEKLFTISQSQQVLCITHHAQVAAMADTHYLINKQVTDEQTSTEMVLLKSAEVIDELARMMSGAEVTQATQDYAVDLMKHAVQIKQAYKKEAIH